MGDIFEIYTGLATVSAKKAETELKRDLMKSVNASQMTESFMDFYERALRHDDTTTLESALADDKQLIDTLK